MRFDNAQFEKNCAQSMSTLDKLKEKIDNTGSGASLSKLGDSAKNIDLSNVEKTLDTLNNKFSILGVMGATIISDLTRNILDMAKKIITTVPNIIKEKGWTRAMNIEQAKFQLEGLGVAWREVADDIDYAVSGTAYGLDAAAKACSQLVASGIQAGDAMKTALRGISGVAAMTNAEYEEIAPIFTTIAGQGKVMTMQLRQLENRGLNAAATMADYFNGVIDGSIEASDSMKAHVNSVTGGMKVTEASIREMVTDGVINFNLFSNAMDNAFGSHAKDANKTFEGVIKNIKAALARIGADFFSPVIEEEGPIVKALQVVRQKIVDIKNAIQPTVVRWKAFVKEFGTGAEKLLKKLDVNFMGNFVAGFANILQGVYQTLKTIGSAFLDVFGKKGNESLQAFADGWEKFTRALILNKGEMEDLREIFKGVFSVIDLVTTVIKELLAALLGINPATVGFRQVLLHLLAVVSELVQEFVKFVKNSQVIQVSIQIMGIAMKALLLVVLKTAEGFSVLVTKASAMEGLQIIFKGIGIAATALAGIITVLINKILYLFNEVAKGNTAVLGPFEKVFLVVKDLFYAAGDGLLYFINKVKDLGIVAAIVETVGKAFAMLIGFVSQLFGNNEITTRIDNTTKSVQGATKAIKILDEEVPKAGNNITKSTNKMTKALDDANNHMKKAKSGISGFVDGIKEYSSQLSIGKVVSIAFAGAVVVMIYKVVNALEQAARGIRAIGTLATTIGRKGVLGVIFGTQEMRVNKLRDVTVLLAAFTAAMVVFTKVITPEELNRASEALVYLAMAFGALAVGLTVLDTIAGMGGKKLSTYGFMLMEFAGAIAIIAGAFAGLVVVLNDKSWETIGKAGAAIAGLMVTLGIFSALMSKLSVESAMGSVAMIGIAASLIVLTKALKELTEVDFTKLSLDKVMVLMDIAGALVILSALAGKLGGKSILTLATSFLMFAVTFKIIEKAAAKLDIAGVLDAVVDGLKAFTEKYGDLLLMIGKVVIVAVVILTVIGKLKTVVGGILGAIKSVGALLGKIKNATEGGIGNATKINKLLAKGINKLGTAAVILAATAALATMTLLFMALAKFVKTCDTQDLVKAGVIMGVFVGLVDSIIIFASMMKGAKGAAALIMAITVEMAAMVAAVVVLGTYATLNAEGAIAGLVGVAGMVVAIGIILDKMSKIKFTPTTAAGIGSITLILLELLAALIALSYAPIDNVLAAGAAISAVMIILGTFMETLGKTGMSFSATKLTAIKEMIKMLVVIGASLAAIAGFGKDWTTIAAAAAGMSTVLIVIAGVMDYIGKINFNPSAGEALLDMCLLLGAIGLSLTALSTFGKDAGNILASAGAMSVVLIVLASISNTIVTASKTFDLKSAAMLLSLCVTLGTVAATLAILSNYDMDKITVSAITLVGTIGVMAIIGSFLSQLQNALIGAATLALLAAALIPAAYALSLIAQYDWISIVAAGATMLVVVGLFAAIAAVIGNPALAAMVSLGAVVIGLLGAALIPAAYAFKIGAEAIQLLAQAFYVFVTAVNLAIPGFLALLAGLSQYKGEFLEMAGGMIALGAASVVLGAGMVVLAAGSLAMSAGGAGLMLLASALPLLADGFKKLQEIDLGDLIKSLLGIIAACTGFALLSPIVLVASAAMLTLSAALTALAASLLIFAKSVATAYNIFKMALPEWIEAGANLLQGFWDGISGMFGTIYDGIVEFGGGIIDKFKDVLGIHSPSEIMEWIGEMTGIGFEGGLEEGLSGVSGMLDGELEEYLDIMGGEETQQSSYEAGYAVGQAYLEAMEKKTRDMQPKVTRAWSEVVAEAGASGAKFADYYGKLTAQKLIAPLQNGLNKMLSVFGGKGIEGPDEDWIQGYKDAINGVVKSTEEDLLPALDDVGGAAGKAEEKVTDLSDAFKNLEKGQKVSMFNMVMNLRNNIAEHVQWAKDVRTMISQGWDEATVEWVKSMGVSGHETVKAFINASSDEFSTYNAMLPTWLEIDNITDEIIKGNMADAGVQYAEAMLQAFNQTFDTNLAETIQDSISPFEEFDKGEEIAANKLIENLQSQLDGVRKWGDNMNILMDKGVNKDILAYFAELGPKSYAEVQAMANMTTEQVEEMNRLWGEKMEIGRQVALTIAQHYQEVGSNITTGLEEGIDFTKPVDKMAQGYTDMENAIAGKNAWDTHSPSRHAIDIGENICTGLKLGIGATLHMPENQMVICGVRTIQAAEEYFSFDQGKTLAGYLVSGLIKGIEAGIESIENAARAAAKAAYDAAMDELNSHSPSRKFMQIGRWIDEGLAIGIEKNTDLVTAASTDMAAETIDQMSAVIAAIAENVNDEMADITPVIKPRLDLSELQNGKSYINGLFGGSSIGLANSIMAGHEVSTSGSSDASIVVPGNSTNIIFNQTNNSPKNIDPYESYRLGRMNLAMMKGALS